jgi:hypothetical protein
MRRSVSIAAAAGMLVRSCVVSDPVDRNHILVSAYIIKHQSSRSLHILISRIQVEDMVVKILHAIAVGGQPVDDDDFRRKKSSSAARFAQHPPSESEPMQCHRCRCVCNERGDMVHETGKQPGRNVRWDATYRTRLPTQCPHGRRSSVFCRLSFSRTCTSNVRYTVTGLELYCAKSFKP